MSLDAHLCFSRKRYLELMKCIRFDIKKDRKLDSNKKPIDKFVHIRQVFHGNFRLFYIYFQIFVQFAENLQSSYEPGEYLTVDEILLPYRGRCPFKMFIPSKASKFGLKLFCVVDPKTNYLLNVQVYLGKSSTKESDWGAKVYNGLI